IFRAVPEAQWKTAVEGIVKQSGLDGKVTNVHVTDPQATKEPFGIAYHVEVAGYVSWEPKRVEVPLPFATEDTAEPPESGKITLGPPGEVAYNLKLRMP